jgi:hypothetical protein
MALPIDGVIVVRQAPDVLAQPRVLLSDWRVFDAGAGCFLAGLLPNGTTMRFTTPIQSVDPAARIWRTWSGRVYETPLPPTTDSELRFLLETTAAAFARGAPITDHTDEFCRPVRGRH